MRPFMKWLASLTTVVMLFVLLGGALVTKTNSGMGCGRSWPLCHGEFVPTAITPEMLIELSHRVVSGLAGILVLILSVWCWRNLSAKREAKFLSFLALFFIVLQALIGAAAVVWGQNPFVLATHFGISLISFSAVLLLTLFIFEVDLKFDAAKLTIHHSMKRHIYGTIVYVYFVVYSGALVRHKKASLACADWPGCYRGSWIPTNEYEWIQMGHRGLAGLIALWIIYATYKAWKEYAHARVIRYTWTIASILVVAQVISGAFIIFTRLNLYVALMHALFVSLLFGALSYLVLLATRSK